MPEPVNVALGLFGGLFAVNWTRQDRSPKESSMKQQLTRLGRIVLHLCSAGFGACRLFFYCRRTLHRLAEGKESRDFIPNHLNRK